jgi:general secretion pathway protein J
MSRGCAACHKRREDGFTLVEALAAVAITALLVSLMFPIVAQWLGSLARNQQALDGEDQLLRSTIALQADLEDMIILPLNDEVKATGSPPIVFRGDVRGVMFPQMRIGGEAAWRPMLIGWTIDRLPDGQEALVRRSSPYDPALRDADPHTFTSQVPLIASKDGIRLTYVGRDGAHADQWSGQTEPPAIVLVEFGRPGARAASAYSLSLTIPVRGGQLGGRVVAPSSGD